MTFDPNIPNAGQSPGLFPAQSNVNFTRLKTIINSDHVFNDTAQSTDGIHRQATMIARAQPVSLPIGSNSILYSWVDGDGQTQLRFYNGSDDFQLTPIVNSGPTKITGSVVVAKDSSSAPVYTVPANTFGTIFVNYIVPAGNFYRYYLFYCSGASTYDASEIRGSSNSGRPSITINNLGQIKVLNNSSSTTPKTIGYYIISESI